jgi:hypothetical protein
MRMAKKRKKSGNLTAEDWERFYRHRRMLEERIAYHEAKAREEDEEEARRRTGS